jgi:hypothetical protein
MADRGSWMADGITGGAGFFGGTAKSRERTRDLKGREKKMTGMEGNDGFNREWTPMDAHEEENGIDGRMRWRGRKAGGFARWKPQAFGLLRSSAAFRMQGAAGVPEWTEATLEVRFDPPSRPAPPCTQKLRRIAAVQRRLRRGHGDQRLRSAACSPGTLPCLSPITDHRSPITDDSALPRLSLLKTDN